MKYIKNLYWFISFKHILLILLIAYIIWLANIFYTTILWIDKMYSDSYDKRVDENMKISKIIKAKNETEADYEDYKVSLDKIMWKQKNIKKVETIIDESIKKTEPIKKIDPIGDESIKKFVTSNKSFDNKKYIPVTLVKISSEYVSDSKWWSQVLRSEANIFLQSMAEQFFKDTWEKIVVVSAYRSYDYQIWIKSRWCPDNLCAKAGFSEHQSGLAVDLWDASTNNDWQTNKKLQKYYKWLNENAHNYGFHNTYQKWLKIDWYEIEPWHWRYLWKELATYLKENNLTIAEYYNNK